MTRGRRSRLSRMVVPRELTATGKMFAKNAYKARALAYSLDHVRGRGRGGGESAPRVRGDENASVVRRFADRDYRTGDEGDADGRPMITEAGYTYLVATSPYVVPSLAGDDVIRTGAPGRGRRIISRGVGAYSRTVRAPSVAIHNGQRSSKPPKDSARIRLFLSCFFSSLSSCLLYPSLSFAHSGSMCAVLARAIQTPIGDLLALLTTTCAFCWPRRWVYMYTVDSRQRRDTAPLHCIRTALPRLRSVGFLTRVAGLSIVAVNVFGLKSPGGDLGPWDLARLSCALSLAVIEGRNRG